jgi:hypothetical protein
MTRIADLLDRDFSRPVEDLIEVGNSDPDLVFTELTEYVATDHIQAEYERLFSALAAAPKSPAEAVGVWISGPFGSGKSSFAKNLGYVLANREVHGTPASSLFLKQVASKRLAESVHFLNRTVPYEVVMFDFQAEVSTQNHAEQIAELMYSVLVRQLDYAEDRDIAELEIELEKEGKLPELQDLCRAEYNEEWRRVRNGSERFARTSALIHRLQPGTYASTNAWLSMVQARPSTRQSVHQLVEKSFDLCESRRRGKGLAFVMDEMGEYLALGGQIAEDLRAVVEHFGKASVRRLEAGRIPGPAWIIVMAHEKVQDISNRLAASRITQSRLEDQFKNQVELSTGDMREVVARRVLRKKESQEPILRKLFRACGASLMQNVALEGSSIRTDFDEDEFVKFYPYLPHLTRLSPEILDGLHLHPNAPIHLGGGNRTLMKQSFEMLFSDRTRLADQPVGALASIDKLYDLVEGNIPWEKQKDVLDISQRFKEEDYPGMPERLAKAICLMEFVQTGLPRTTKNIAALLVQRVTEAPPTATVSTILYHLKAAHFVRETEDGWKLNNLDDLRKAAAGLETLRKAVGTINPRPPGWHNNLIQGMKKLLARSLVWYTRPQHEFNAAVSQSLQGTVGAVDHLFRNMVALDHLSMKMTDLEQLSTNVRALEVRLAESERRNAALTRLIQEQQIPLAPEQVNAPISFEPSGNERTIYIIGLFGTGRRYINEIILQNIGERAKYFRDSIGLHPGPTPMIYSGHATIRHASRDQASPEVMSRILEAVRSRFADSIFVYRHPLDSLLTNWVWWRTYIRDHGRVSGISQVYKSTDDLCADLEQNFLDFKAFAEGDPDFFSATPGPRFLSFPEFVEETELHLQSATLALRLEDFMTDPFREFSKIADIMSVDLDVSRVRVSPPRTKPYGYLAVQAKVPRFRNFIDGLDGETKRRIASLGYTIG